MREDDESRILDTYVKLVRAAETVTTAVHRHLGEETLTISQFGVLEALYNLGPLYQKEVAAKILKSTANITTVIDNLEKRELVQRVRNDEDRRYIRVYLTGQGKEMMDRIFPRHVSVMRDLLSVLSTDEQRHLASLCKKLGLGVAGR